jgi:hypothetical protein
MIKHLEGLLDATVAHLRLRFPYWIDWINAEEGDFVLDAPKDAPGEPDDGYVVGGWTTLRYPTVEVAIPDWSMTNFSIAQQVSDLSPRLVVRTWAAEPQPKAGLLYRKLLRYGRATILSLTEPGAFGQDEDTRVIVDGMEGRYRFDPETDQREEIVGGALVVFSLGGVETLP